MACAHGYWKRLRLSDFVDGLIKAILKERDSLLESIRVRGAKAFIGTEVREQE